MTRYYQLIGPEGQITDEEDIADDFPGLVFENNPEVQEQLDSTPEPLVTVQGNEKSSQPQLGAGSRSDSSEVITSLLEVPNPDPSPILRPEPPSPGLEPIVKALSEALRPIQNTLEEQRKVLALLQPENSSSSKRHMRSGTPPNIRHAGKSSQRTRQRGSGQRPVLTGRPPQASGRSPTSAPSARPSAGTGSTSRTAPTGRSSNPSSRPVSIVLPQSPPVPAPRTSAQGAPRT